MGRKRATNEREVRRGILGLSRRRIRGTRLLMVMIVIGKRETVLGVKKIVTGVREIVKEVNVIGVTVTEEITRGVVVIRGIKPEVTMTGWIVTEVIVTGAIVTGVIVTGWIVTEVIVTEVIVTGAIVTEVIGTEGIMTEGIMTEVIGVTVIRMVLTEGIVMWTGEGMKVVIVIGLVGKKGIMMQKKITRVQLISTRLGRETRMKIVADIVTPLLHRVRTRRESLRKVKENKRDIPLVLILTEIDMT